MSLRTVVHTIPLFGSELNKICFTWGYKGWILSSILYIEYVDLT